MKTYAEKLKDPRWQRRRLEIMQRDGFKCTICRDSDNQLHIHHKRYHKRTEPWDYPDDDLCTLCEDCHSKVSILKEWIGYQISHRCWFWPYEALAFIAKQDSTEERVKKLSSVLQNLSDEPEHIEWLWDRLQEKFTPPDDENI